MCKKEGEDAPKRVDRDGGYTAASNDAVIYVQMASTAAAPQHSCQAIATLATWISHPPAQPPKDLGSQVAKATHQRREYSHRVGRNDTTQ
jgi:hypothetical protein